jgi:Xaa-Pro aminopeptidase
VLSRNQKFSTFYGRVGGDEQFPHDCRYPHIGGIRIEDTIVVTKEGYEMLAPCPKKLEI